MARFRPLNASERRRVAAAPAGSTAASPCVRFQDKSVVRHVSNVDGSEYPYTFDRVFHTETTQAEIYAAAAAPITQAVLQGYNGTIFAYGQTSSGKTFTMTGNPDDLHDPEVNGIIPRTVHSIFDGIAEADEDTEFTLSVQYVEIYMEKVRDLLADPAELMADRARGGFGGSYKNNLQITEDALGVPGLPNAEKVYVGSDEEIFDLLQRGNAARATSSTKMNEQSSRSHAVFILSVKQNSPSFSKTGVLYLVDLAGSEKVKNTGASGMRLDEAKQINKSLSTLGRVINMLTAGAAHVPYRDSKLTRLLQQSLGGNAKTTLLICCSPASSNAEETKSTLEFGLRAKKIKNRAKVNSQRSREELMRMLKSCERLIDALKARVMVLEEKMQVPMAERFIKGPPAASKSSTPRKKSAAAAGSGGGGGGDGGGGGAAAIAVAATAVGAVGGVSAAQSGERIGTAAASQGGYPSSHQESGGGGVARIDSTTAAATSANNHTVVPPAEHVALLSEVEAMRTELVETRERLRSLVDVTKTRERDMANLESSMEDQRERIRIREAECDTKTFEVKSALEFVVSESLRNERESIRQMREAAERELSASQVEFAALRKAVLLGVSDAVQREKAAHGELAAARAQYENSIAGLTTALEGAQHEQAAEREASASAAESRATEIADLKHREETLTKEVSALKVEGVRHAAESARQLSGAQSETDQLRTQMTAELEQQRHRVAVLTKGLADETQAWSAKLASEKETLSEMRQRSERFEEGKRKEEEQRIEAESALAGANAHIARLEREKEHEARAAQQARAVVETLQTEAQAQVAGLEDKQRELSGVALEKARLGTELKRLQAALDQSEAERLSARGRATQLERQLKDEQAALVALGERANTAAKSARAEQEGLAAALSGAEANAERLFQDQQNVTVEMNAARIKFEEQLQTASEAAAALSAENQKLRQEKNSLQQDVETKSSEMSTERELRRAAEQAAKTMQGGLARVREEVERQKGRVEQCEADLHGEKVRAEKASGEISELRGKNEVMAARIQEQMLLIDGEEGLRARAAKVGPLEIRVHSVRADLEATQAERDELKTAFAAFRAHAAGTQAESSSALARSAAELDGVRNAHAERERTVSRLERELGVVREAAQATESRLNEELQNTRERCGRLEEQRKTGEERANTTQERLDRVRVELREAQTALARSETTSESHEAATKRQEKVHGAVLQQLKDQEAECKGLRDALEAMRREAAEASGRYTSLEEARDRLHRMIEGGGDENEEGGSGGGGNKDARGGGIRREGLRARAARVAPLQQRVEELIAESTTKAASAFKTEAQLKAELDAARVTVVELEQIHRERREEFARAQRRLEERVATVEAGAQVAALAAEELKKAHMLSEQEWSAKLRAREELVASGQAEASRLSGRIEELQASIEEGKLREMSLQEARAASEVKLEAVVADTRRAQEAGAAEMASASEWKLRSENLQRDLKEQAHKVHVVESERNALKLQIEGGSGDDGIEVGEGLRARAQAASILEVKLTSQKSILLGKEKTLAALEEQIAEQRDAASKLQKSYADEVSALRDRCARESERADAASRANAQKEVDHRAQMARALEVARGGEEKAAIRMREEHRKAMVSATEGYAVRLRKVEVQYAADAASAKEHFAKETEAMKQRHARHLERLEQKFGDEKQRAIDDCIQCSQSELDMALQASTKAQEDAILWATNEHQRKILQLRSELEREKENAVEACLQSTLEEMSMALETAHAQRRYVSLICFSLPSFTSVPRSSHLSFIFFFSTPLRYK
jgi:kinesin family protein 5